MARHPQRDLYESTLVEIGRITTTWAKFEHWVDVAIWYLADVEDRRGACITTQLGSIHAKFRALEALMVEAGRPEPILKIIRGIAGEAAGGGEDAKQVRPSTARHGCEQGDPRVRSLPQPLVFSDEEGDAVEAGFVDVKREPVAQIDAVANAATGGRGQIAMQRHHPLQDLILMAATTT